MIEITASDIFWIGAMDKIEIGLIVMFLFGSLFDLYGCRFEFRSNFLICSPTWYFFYDCMGSLFQVRKLWLP